jgi:hypothetical protein
VVFAVRKALVRVDDDVLDRINLTKRFADVEAGDTIGASDFETYLRSRLPDDPLNKTSLFL